MKCILPIIAVLVCVAAAASRVPIDQVPMYGGLDRQAVPELKKGDQNFVEAVAKEFGSRERAAEKWIEQGFRFYGSNDIANAMRRFNQAWLLDPKNPQVFWGFGAVLHDQDQAFAAYEMFKRGYDLGLRDPQFLADLGKVALVRIVERKHLPADQRSAFKKESETYFEEAIKSEKNLAYIYGVWASARYWQEDYAGAWQKVALARKYGPISSPGFLKRLSEKMPEPK